MPTSVYTSTIYIAMISNFTKPLEVQKFHSRHKGLIKSNSAKQNGLQSQSYLKTSYILILSSAQKSGVDIAQIFI